MDFFDDETSRAPADAAGPPSSPSRRRPPDRRRNTRIQRLAIGAIVLFLIVLGLAWWARSCQHSRKVDSYATYFEGVSQTIAHSNALGKTVSSIMKDPTKLSRQQLVAQLETLATKQEGYAVDAAHLEAPDTLEAEQSSFANGMKVRASGFRLLRTAMLGALSNKKVTAQDIAAIDGYFSGPDAYYQEQVYAPSRETMQKEGIAGVAVPTSTYYLTWKALDPVRIQETLDTVGKSAKLTGIHGVALSSVTAQSSGGDIKLTQGDTIEVPASADLAFVVEVQNQGSVAEHDVKVVASLKLPGGDVVKQSGTIAVIDSRKTGEVTISGFAIPETALSKEVTLTVKAGPVTGERTTTNNSATYKLLLQLQ